MVDTMIIIVVLVVIVFVAIGGAIMLRKKKSFCPSCGFEWREGAMTCMKCKYSPYLPPAHVALDTGAQEYDMMRSTYSTHFEGDARDPWVRRNF